MIRRFTSARFSSLKRVRSKNPCGIRPHKAFGSSHFACANAIGFFAQNVKTQLTRAYGQNIGPRLPWSLTLSLDGNKIPHIGPDDTRSGDTRIGQRPVFPAVSIFCPYGSACVFLPNAGDGNGAEIDANLPPLA